MENNHQTLELLIRQRLEYIFTPMNIEVDYVLKQIMQRDADSSGGVQKLNQVDVSLHSLFQTHPLLRDFRLVATEAVSPRFGHRESFSSISENEFVLVGEGETGLGTSDSVPVSSSPDVTINGNLLGPSLDWALDQDQPYTPQEDFSFSPNSSVTNIDLSLLMCALKHSHLKIVDGRRIVRPSSSPVFSAPTHSRFASLQRLSKSELLQFCLFKGIDPRERERSEIISTLADLIVTEGVESFLLQNKNNQSIPPKFPLPLRAKRRESAPSRICQVPNCFAKCHHKKIPYCQQHFQEYT